VDGRVVTEKQVTLAIARRALPLLRRSGYRVVMSRTGDTTVARLRPSDVHRRVLTPAGAQREIEARNLCADAARATVLIALHMDSFSGRSAHGAEAFYCPNRPFAARSRRLADALQRAIRAQLSRAGLTPSDRGVLPDRAGGGAALTPQTAGYHHLIELGPADPPWLPYPSLMPGVLLEPAFLSNPGDAAFVVSARGQRVLAAALVAGLHAYLRSPAPS
jgi:N-acetylmuramoyl-L-alanine amidase